jgi:hypothetical protein
MEMSGKWIGITLAIVVVVATAVGVGAYSAGKSAGETAALTARTNFIQQRAGGNSAATTGFTDQGGAGSTGARGGMAGNFAGGQVKSVNGDTIELSTATEVLKVKVTGQTQYQKTVNGSLNDVQVGERVVIQGDRGADGTLTARSVQIGGGGAFFGGRGGTGGQ